MISTIARRKLMGTIMLGTIGLMIILVVMFYTAYFMERNPLFYPNIPFPTSQEAYLPGDEVSVEVRRCVDYSLTYSFSARLVRVAGSGVVNIYTLNGGSISVDVPEDKNAPFCEHIQALRQILPKKDARNAELLPGDYRIEYDIFEIQGRLKQHKTHAFTEPFRIERSPVNRDAYIQSLNIKRFEEEFSISKKQSDEKGIEVVGDQKQEQKVEIKDRGKSDERPEPTRRPSFFPHITLPLPTLEVLGL